MNLIPLSELREISYIMIQEASQRTVVERTSGAFQQQPDCPAKVGVAPLKPSQARKAFPGILKKSCVPMPGWTRNV